LVGRVNDPPALNDPTSVNNLMKIFSLTIPADNFVDYICQNIICQFAMNNFGQKIREIRDQKGEPLRIVAFHLGIDQAILSKIENGKRKANRKLVELMAEYYSVSEKDLIIEWLSDKIIYDIDGDEYGIEALKIAEQKATYKKPESEL
jgi:transcriptional regulator with XRE-family HTH domain